jgi:anhydro-N-acetylmuramic acid kinase
MTAGARAGADPVARLLELRARPSRRVVGLSSGTSADAIDAALVEIEGSGADTRVRLVRYAETPIAPALRARLLAALDAHAAELAALDVAVGAAFAEAATRLLAGEPADLVGSHGQTVCHLPRSAGHPGATLQIGQAAIIAERLGVPVVCDFRVADVAAGGEGAPLVPLADFYLFRAPGRVRALQNLGGIANVTVVGERLDQVLAFDNGPGNMPLDEAVRAASGGAESCDLGGARAARGRIDPALLDELHGHPFFALPPPRSTGREAFGRAWLEPLLVRYAGRVDDLLASLTRFVAEAIRESYARHVEPCHRIDEILVSGGGLKNATLMRHLGELFAPVPVRSSATAGVDPDAKEAIAFAILANETLHGRPGNVPAATGAAGPRVLGKILP